MSGDLPGPAYHHQQRGFPLAGSGLGSSSDSINQVDHSFSSTSSTTSGFASGSEGSGSGFQQQRLVGAGLGVSREQGVRDLRSIIQ